MMNTRTMLGLGIVVIALFLYFFYFKKNTPVKKSDGDDDISKTKNDKCTIYGSMACPYTVKQREKYPDHEFVDCSGGGCPTFVTAFPTTKWSDGKIDVGFS